MHYTSIGQHCPKASTICNELTPLLAARMEERENSHPTPCLVLRLREGPLTCPWLGLGFVEPSYWCGRNNRSCWLRLPTGISFIQSPLASYKPSFCCPQSYGLGQVTYPLCTLLFSNWKMGKITNSIHSGYENQMRIQKSLAISYKVKYSLSIWLCNSIPRYLPRRNESMSTFISCNVHSSSIHNQPQPGNNPKVFQLVHG